MRDSCHEASARPRGAARARAHGVGRRAADRTHPPPPLRQAERDSAEGRLLKHVSESRCSRWGVGVRPPLTLTPAERATGPHRLLEPAAQRKSREREREREEWTLPGGGPGRRTEGRTRSPGRAAELVGPRERESGAGGGGEALLRVLIGAWGGEGRRSQCKRRRREPHQSLRRRREPNQSLRRRREA